MEIASVKLKNRPVATLIPYANNARTHDEKQIKQIASSIKEFGFNNPVLIDVDDGIIAGHGRVQAAALLGLKEIPTITLPHLSEAQKKAYILADNRMALDAGWDAELLKLELTNLDDLGFDLGLTGFDHDEISEFLKEELDPQSDEDAVPELPIEPVSKIGDVWLLGDHRVMCGDSSSIDAVEKLMDGQKADMVFTDPPYNIAEKGKNVASNVKDGKAYNVLKDSKWDYGFEPEPFLNNLLPTTKEGATVFVCTSHFLFGSIQKWMETNFEYDNYCVWCKPNPMPSLTKRRFTWATELICYGTRGKGFVFNFPETGHCLNYNIENSPSHTTPHPTEKPVSLPQKYIELTSKQEDIVLDLFGGSGSTLIACEKIGRNARLMEFDPKYIDVIVTRWQEYTGKSAILEGTNKTYSELNKELLA